MTPRRRRNGDAAVAVGNEMDDRGEVKSEEQTSMPTQKGAETRVSAQAKRGAGVETEPCLDSFLGVLEYLSEATGLSIEDIADLLSGKESPIGAMVLASHLQTQAPIKPQLANEESKENDR